MYSLISDEHLISAFLFAVLVLCVYCVRAIYRNVQITELQDSLTFVPHRGQTKAQMHAENEVILQRIEKLRKQKF